MRLAAPAVLGLMLVSGMTITRPVVAAVRLAVVSQDGGSITEIDMESHDVVATVTLAKGPAGIAASPDDGLLYVTYPNRGVVGVVDAVQGKALPDIPYRGEPFGIAAGHGTVYVSDWTKDRVTRIDTTSRQITAVVAVGKSPAGLVVDPSGHRLYVADRESGDVTVIDAETMHVISAVPTGSAPFALALAPDGKHLYVANVRSNDLAVIDTRTLERIASIPVGAMPYGVAVTPDGAEVLVTNQHGDTLSIVDVHARKVVATIPVGRYPEGVFAGPAGIAYVANWFSGDVSVVDLAERREIRRLKVGDGPRSFARLADSAGSP